MKLMTSFPALQMGSPTLSVSIKTLHSRICIKRIRGGYCPLSNGCRIWVEVIESSTMKSATNLSAEVPLINGKSPSTSCCCQWIHRCRGLLMQRMLPTTPLAHVLYYFYLFLNSAALPWEPHTARSVKRAVRAPCAASTELDTGLVVVQLPGNMPNTSAVKFSALDDRTVTSRSLSDLQGYWLCMMLEVGGAEFWSLESGDWGVYGDYSSGC